MRIFKRIIDDARAPGENAERYPKAPDGVSSEQDLAQWRVQSLLMSAEVRYSMYLTVLYKWCAEPGNHFEKDIGNWPLPPWDVAIIFYCHLLTPLKFQSDMEEHFPRIWAEDIQFPLSRLSSTVLGGASDATWKQMFPDEPYQIIEFDADGRSSCVKHEHLGLADKAMDIRGFKCAKASCPMYDGKVPIPMANYCQYRVSKMLLICPLCGQSSERKETGTGARRVTEHYQNGSPYWSLRSGFNYPVFDLWEAPLRQFNNDGFVDRVLTLADDPSTALPITQATTRYLKFLQLLKDSKSAR